jgi:hypothetical protein
MFALFQYRRRQVVGFVRSSGHLLFTSGQRLSLTAAVFTPLTAGHIVPAGGHVVSGVGHVVSAGGHDVSVGGHVVSVAGH